MAQRFLSMLTQQHQTVAPPGWELSIPPYPKSSIGLKSDDCGDAISTVNLLSC